MFLSENFQFLEVKFSIYLNRRVFVTSSYSRTSLNDPKTHFPMTRLMYGISRQVCLLNFKGLNTLGSFSAIFTRETFLRLPDWFPAHQPYLKKGLLQKGKDLLTLGAKFFSFKKTFSLKKATF